LHTDKEILELIVYLLTYKLIDGIDGIDDHLNPLRRAWI